MLHLIINCLSLNEKSQCELVCDKPSCGVVIDDVIKTWH